MTPHPRHHRQTLLPQIGPQGQAALAGAHALIIGCGALGAVAAELLCRAGVGTLSIVDRDVVEHTNLQRQGLFCTRDAEQGLPKAVAAAARLAEIDPAVRVRAIVGDATARTACALILQRVAPDLDTRPEGAAAPVGVILDATDNFQTRFLLNDLSIKHEVPLIYAGAIATRAMSISVVPHKTACLRCVFGDPPSLDAPQRSQTCDTVGVLGPAAWAIASVQAAEAIKVLAGRAADLRPTLLELDLWTGDVRSINLDHAKRDDCPCCAARRFDFLEAIDDQPATLCGTGAVQITPASAGRVDIEALARRLSPHGTFSTTRFLVRGTLTAEHAPAGAAVSLTVFPDGRAFVGGVDSPQRARAIYARYIGA